MVAGERGLLWLLGVVVVVVVAGGGVVYWGGGLEGKSYCGCCGRRFGLLWWDMVGLARVL